MPRPRGPLWKNRHRSHSSRLPSRDGENNDFSPTKICKFYHLIFLVFLSDFLHITRILIVHPTQVGKYTAYGSMIYTHTALHLASRNGHTRSDIFLRLIMKFLAFVSKNKSPSQHLRVVEELLRVGLDINVRTARGTALHEAALCGKVFDNHFWCLDMARCLIITLVLFFFLRV